RARLTRAGARAVAADPVGAEAAAAIATRRAGRARCQRRHALAGPTEIARRAIGGSGAGRAHAVHTRERRTGLADADPNALAGAIARAVDDRAVRARWAAADPRWVERARAGAVAFAGGAARRYPLIDAA